jgi:hypothetical protein
MTTLLLSPEQLALRRTIAARHLAPLARSLAHDLSVVAERPLYFPDQKALLSRQGGRCPRDGTMLDFDPYSPHEHRCPRCGETYRGELHHRFWIYWYQLWLAERAVHAAVLSTLTDSPEFQSLAERILDGYAERYLRYPNVDNVLGPTRPFFSTYLESIWLLQIGVAADLLCSRAPAVYQRTLDRIVEPSRAIIAEYDEGGSNRQVWNDVALFAAARLVGDNAAAERALYGSSGLLSHLGGGLLADGTWFEGENYHLFAHRGLWYGVTMAGRAGLEIPATLVERFDRGFAAPFATALPDFTLPSRRDSQYAISLRQWRIAEHCELGLARREDAVLVGALHRMYDDDVPRHATGRDRSSADVERNSAPSALSRADLSWRALLFARPEFPRGESTAPASVLLESQGIAVFRRGGGQVYAALDYGTSGGGHGHPDRLNLLLAAGAVRWLDDFGTGSYVDPSLHWYRSTLAHNAPLVNGYSQTRIDGELAAYDERGSVGWISAVAMGAAPGVLLSRTVVVMPEYALDIVRWESREPATIDLPLHADLAVRSGASDLRAAAIDGSGGVEDGFRFLRDTAVQTVRAGDVVIADAVRDGAALALFACSHARTEWWSGTAPGPPGTGDHRFRIIRAAPGVAGELRLIWSWNGDVTAVEFGDSIRVHHADGRCDEHMENDSGWRVNTTGPRGSTMIQLSGVVDEEPDSYEPSYEPLQPAFAPESVTVPIGDRAIVFELGARQYRRSEQDWHSAGEPRASVTLQRTGAALRVTVDVEHSDCTFVASGAVNPYDNEPPDINGDGVQLYIRSARGPSAWLLVPEHHAHNVRPRQIEGWNADNVVNATWIPTTSGYQMTIDLPADEPPLAIDVLINEKPAGRERRRGQLVLSGAEGEFVYLRGDRHDPGRLIALRFANG